MLLLIAGALVPDARGQDASFGASPAEFLLNADPAAPPKTAPGVLEVAPLVLPTPKYLLGTNDFFGWPVAAAHEDAMVVLYHRVPQHYGDRAPLDGHSSRAVMVRSPDRGAHWYTPVDLRDFIKRPTEGCRVGFGNALGVTDDGILVAVTRHGVFRSKNGGKKWKHYPKAFSAKQLKGPPTNTGPRMVTHPKYGLILPGHFASGTNEDGTERIADAIWLRYSQDGGKSWKEAKQDLPEWVKPVEPAALVIGDALVLLARCHGGFEPLHGTWPYVQLVSRDGSPPLTPALSNIRASDTGESPWQGPWSQDTADLTLNPVTGRVEAVVTNRCGGGQGREHIHTHMTLNLWSIDPETLLEGGSTWRFEGTLLMRVGTAVTGVDGMHPGGGVIDAQRGVQHVFVYLGYPPGPSGIFRITRTLDTPKLHTWLNEDARP